MAWSKGSSRRKSELPPDWGSLRKQVLDRDGHRCVFCLGEATDVDHIIPGSDHSMRNLRSLCRSCHMRRTGAQGAEARRRKTGYRRTLRKPGKHPGML